jgi:hypothetical protein
VCKAGHQSSSWVGRVEREMVMVQEVAYLVPAVRLLMSRIANSFVLRFGEVGWGGVGGVGVARVALDCKEFARKLLGKLLPGGDW